MDRQQKIAYYKKKRQEKIDIILESLNLSGAPQSSPLSSRTPQPAEIQYVYIKKTEILSLERPVDAQVHFRPQPKVETYCQEVQVELIGARPETRESATEITNLDLGLTEMSAQEIEVLEAIEQKDDKLSTEEIKATLESQEFLLFIDKSSKLVEKALDHKDPDLYEDMIKSEVKTDLVDENSNELLQELQIFSDRTLTNNRLVTSINWSPNMPELFMASYDPSPEGNPNESQGLLLLWSLSLRSRPEFTCSSQSKITAAAFNKYSNSTIIGATYSGQIVMWDLRAKSSPVQKSGITNGGHAHPVYSLAVVGTQNSHNIVSMSNDGTLCVWNPASLAVPVKQININGKKQEEGFNNTTINPTCFAFSDREVNNFYNGSEDGSIYGCKIHSNREFENPMGTFSGHQAPITSLSYIPENSCISPETSNLLLSSSYDWTVKLWSPRECSQSLWSFESAEDSVLDVCWNPANPMLFSSVDTEGYIDLWDLSKELETPLARKRGDKRALNKLCWSRDGSKMIVGGARGELKMYGLQDKMLRTNRENVEKFETVIDGLVRKAKKHMI